MTLTTVRTDTQGDQELPFDSSNVLSVLVVLSFVHSDQERLKPRVPFYMY